MIVDGDTGAIRMFAPAKVNLYLHVTGRRADGYHLLDSLVVFADVGDTVTVSPDRTLSFEVNGPFAAGVPINADNLVLRAANALATATGVTPHGRIRLTKNLPPASGIGGGSADAAATLHGLMALWGVRPPPSDLHRIALALGADVPVCMYRRPAYFGGVGDEITPAPALPPTWLVLANPGIAVSTQAVFHERAGAFSAAGRLVEAPADAPALAARLAERRNDLASAAMSLAPAINEVHARLEAAPGALLVRMSGSGATVFAIFAKPDTAAAAAAAIARERPAWWVRVAAVLTEADSFPVPGRPRHMPSD
ncbi:MAG: 4-(cytidine 5'-diphospho)-2-C-methyl-D-erythritol kinase [Rhodospirillales bacterium]|nr:MAG: 4-(cytidine 5'-diphospho)-2-C-methyl-D-erythritol kinase [Rhodospirillales bacterium]